MSLVRTTSAGLRPGPEFSQPADVQAELRIPVSATEIPAFSSLNAKLNAKRAAGRRRPKLTLEPGEGWVQTHKRWRLIKPYSRTRLDGCGARRSSDVNCRQGLVVGTEDHRETGRDCRE